MKTRAMIRLDALLGLPLCAVAYVCESVARFLRRPPPVNPAVRRILVTKFLGLGSILLATPLLRHLRAVYPNAHITFLTLSPNADLVRRLAFVDEVVVVRRRGLLPLLAGVPALLVQLRRQQFDLALDLEFYSRLSNLVTWGSGARRRVGFFVRARWRGSLLTDSVYFNSRLPFGDAVLALLRPLGLEPTRRPEAAAPRLTAAEEAAAHARLVTLGVPETGTLVVINVNASDLCVERRWPGERFARLVERFGDEVARVDRYVFIGGPGEEASVQAVLDQIATEMLPSCLDLSGRTSLPELITLLRRAALLITNDSGPMHLAAVQGVPTVSFFGPETPDLYGPQQYGASAEPPLELSTELLDVPPTTISGGSENHLVFYVGHWCSPCLSVYNAKIAMCHGENECMRRIELDDVVSKAAVFCRERVGLAPGRRSGLRGSQDRGRSGSGRPSTGSSDADRRPPR
jgi:ADP-heptose:LPS heptosyltransferase